MSSYIIADLIILVFSAIIHEVCHGLMAERFGDDTARRAGRITLNPIPHIDPYGSILLPLLMWVSTGGRFVFASAKPVPVDFDNLRPQRLGMAMVSLAGPLSNIALAIVGALLLKLPIGSTALQTMLVHIVYLNILLGIFNLIPIPPLDGSKVLLFLAPTSIAYRFLRFERYGFILILLLVFTGVFGYILYPALAIFAKVFGINLL